MGTSNLCGRYDLLARPIEFVLATEDGTLGEQCAKSSKLQLNSLSGKEAKKMYEDIINESPNTHAKLSQMKKATKRRKATLAEVKRNMKKKQIKENNVSAVNLTKNDLFKAAQSGDLHTAEKCIRNFKLDVNATDDYSWTPLMMAAYEGHHEIVSLLLLEGAEWMNQTDGSGYDARDLACLGGHGEIADLLMNSERHIRKRKVAEHKEKALKSIKREKLWCEICKCHYYASLEKDLHDSHLSSTLHLISDRDFTPPCHSHFYISGSNRGYQLLKKDGWDGESGLGPNGAGQKYPVKTVLKRDRLGLGSSDKVKARVTHFGANDRSAIKLANCNYQESNSRTTRKNYLHKKDEEQRKKEINFRRLFH